MTTRRQRKISDLLVMIEDQKKWIERCGGHLSGYIESYGDPGIPPTKDGKPHTITVPQKDVKLFVDRLVPVKGVENLFYSPHIGDGGTAIWEADSNVLKMYEHELAVLTGS